METKENKKTKGLKIKVCIIAVIAISLIFGLWYTINFGTRFVNAVSIEAGSPITMDLFFDNKIPNGATFATDMTTVRTDIPGTYTIPVSLDDRVYEAQLTVKDTVSPVVTVKPTSAWQGKPISPEECIENASDATALSVTWQTQPIDVEGEQKGVIAVTDLGGNVTFADVTVVITADNTAPVIEGVSDLEIFLHDDIDLLSGVKVTDDKDSEPSITVDMQGADLTKPGEYDCKYIACDGAGNLAEQSFKVTISEDTKAPEVVLSESYNIPLNGNTDILTLISTKDDSSSPLTVITQGEVGQATEGSYPITYNVSDRSGNTTVCQCIVNVGVDTTAPVISVKPILIFLGDTVSYKKQIVVTDDYVGTPKVTVDSSKVDLNTIGEYTVSFTAVDSSGNTATAETPVSVIERPSVEEDAHRLADELLAKLVTEDMTELEKLFAIYNWTNRKIYYSGVSDKSNYIVGAYDGITTLSGDCYTYYAICRLLLEHMGYEQIEVNRVHPTTRHYWSLVYFNDGWYHFDPSRFIDGNGLTFMLTDQELEAWDKQYYSIGHIFNHDLYPERTTESLQHLVDYQNRKIIKE